LSRILEAQPSKSLHLRTGTSFQTTTTIPGQRYDKKKPGRLNKYIERKTEFERLNNYRSSHFLYNKKKTDNYTKTISSLRALESLSFFFLHRQCTQYPLQISHTNLYEQPQNPPIRTIKSFQFETTNPQILGELKTLEP